MITDIRTLESGASLDADICIIGGGAAAIAMCLELAKTSLRIAVLESGGLDRNDESQSLAKGSQSGVSYFALDDSRYRLLGGSTYRWGARTTPLKPIDFEVRPHVADSGWPISLAELDPYFSKALPIIGSAEDFAYDQGVWSILGGEAPAIDTDRLEHTAFQFGKNLLLGDVHRAALAQAPNVHVYLNANATNLQLADNGGRIGHIDVRTLDGKSFTMRAQRYVLASGGIENARLMLASSSVHPTGVGNHSGLVGRCFMEHPTASVGVIEASNPQRVMDMFSPGLLGGRLVETGWALSPAMQAEAACLNAYGRAVAVVSRDATQALREILWNMQHRRMPLQLSWYGKNKWLAQRLAAVASDPLSIITNAIRHKQGKPKRFKIDSLALEVRIEQKPNPFSRITLSDDVDALGMRRAHLHWDLTAQEKLTFQVAAREIGRELERLGLGRLKLAAWLEGDALTWPADLVGGHHHMGATRMSDDPDKGVVDRNCRVHGVDNLYVAGSSVFPTSGYANPTATLLSLALRLADHLPATLQSAGRPASTITLHEKQPSPA